MRARIVLALIAAAAVAACGESDAEKAEAQVCESRDEIRSEVQTLQQLTPQTVTADAVRGSVDSIRDDLKEISEARGDLGDDLREDVEAANETFSAEVRQVASTVLRSTSVEEARAQLSGAVDQLAEAYRTSFGTVECES